MIGGICQGFGMGLFLFPNAIPSGGGAGIAILLNYFFNLNMGLALWIVNFSLMLVGIKFLGKRFFLWTVFGITITSSSVDFFETYFMIPDRLIVYDLMIGSIFLGIGVGLLMRSNVSNGGIGVIAIIISHYRDILPGRPLFFINAMIFIITAAIISWEIFFLALMSQWISTTVIDIVCRLDFTKTYRLDWIRKS